MGKTERLHHQGWYDPVPCLRSNVVPWRIWFRKRRLRSGRRERKQLTGCNRWFHRTSVCTSGLWRVAACGSFSVRLYRKGSDRFHHGRSCKCNWRYRRCSNRCTGCTDMVPYFAGSTELPDLQPAGFSLSGCNCNHGTADAVQKMVLVRYPVSESLRLRCIPDCISVRWSGTWRSCIQRMDYRGSSPSGTHAVHAVPSGSI